MKKITFILLAIFALSCSNDDAPAPANNTEYFYTVSIKHTCPSNSDATLHCVSKETYDLLRAERQQNAGEPCYWVEVPALDGLTYAGFYTSATQYTYNPCAED